MPRGLKIDRIVAHYRSKDDLRRSGLEHMRRLLLARQTEALARPVEPGKRGLSFTLALFEHAREYKNLYRALRGGRGGTITLAGIRQIAAELVRNELPARIDTAADENGADAHELVVQYVVGAIMAVLTWWLDRGAKVPPQRVDTLLQHLALTGFLGAAP